MSKRLAFGISLLVLAVAGVALLVVGTWRIYPSAGLIVAGSLLLALLAALLLVDVEG